jgi:UDP-N-acetylmuramyl tripeptide synthase
MIVHAFETTGFSVCSNLEGANMKPGAATTIIKNTTKSGRFTKEYLVLEVDERSLASVAEVLPPGNLCVVNIQKDQVQRNGDPDYIYQKIKAAVAGLKAARLFVNNDEPRSKSLGAFIPDGCRVVSFGVAQNARGSETETGWGVTMPCPLCHNALTFDYYNLAGVGAFHCEGCGFTSGGPADYLITEVDYKDGTFRAGGKAFSNKTFRLAYPAAFFLYS